MNENVSDILGELVNESQLEAQEDASSAGLDENDNAIVRLANQIIADAFRQGTSDIHIEPYGEKRDTLVRFRVDGDCFEYMKIPPSYRRAIVSRLKIMASLDIAERRKPQDGKIKFKIGENKEIELRVATIPTAGYNEDVVMRILAASEPLPVDKMGFSERNLREIKSIAEKPYGIILCVGPTGSGKTTTLHSVLGYINTPDIKIWTAEDPVEITQYGLRQVQVHSKIGFTFAAAMRAFLRADPDVIMVGEMRDKETADTGIEASLTGHLVLSTLHTNSAVETITRLLDMGCDSFSFADAMLGVLAQRLARRICKDCKEAYQPSKEEYEELRLGYGPEYWDTLGITFDANFRLYRGKGCDTCNRTGLEGPRGATRAASGHRSNEEVDSKQSENRRNAEGRHGGGHDHSGPGRDPESAARPHDLQRSQSRRHQVASADRQSERTLSPGTGTRSDGSAPSPAAQPPQPAPISSHSPTQGSIAAIA